jgi:mRNA interferase MazF
MDEVVRDTDADFPETGLRMTSLIRVARLAVVSRGKLGGAAGQLSEKRLHRAHGHLAHWIDDEASDAVSGQ